DIPEEARRDEQARRDDTTLPPPPIGEAIGEAIGETVGEYVSDGSSRPITAEYIRPSIPIAPNDDLEIDVEIEEPKSVVDVQEQGVSTGLSGARRWRERFEAIRGCVELVSGNSMPPDDVVKSMALAERS